MARKRGSRRRAGASYGRIGLICVIVAVVLLAAAALIKWKPWNRANANDPGQNGQEVESPETPLEVSLEKDQIAEVDQLISEYFQAKIDQDAQTLCGLFGDTSEERIAAQTRQLAQEAKVVEDYQEIACYTFDGLDADSYVAYVTYQVKFRRVDTLAPGMMWCYVTKDADSGNLMIRENVIGDEADYVARVNQSEAVTQLSAQVNAQLKEALESDSLLAGAYKQLQDGAILSENVEGGDSSVSIETSGESESESSEAESAPQESDADSQVQIGE